MNYLMTAFGIGAGLAALLILSPFVALIIIIIIAVAS